MLSLQAVREVRICSVLDSSENEGLAGSGLFSCSSVREAGYERPDGGTTFSRPSRDRDGLTGGGHRGEVSMMQSTSVATRTSVVGNEDKPIFVRLEDQADFKVIMQRRQRETSDVDKEWRGSRTKS